MTLFVPVLMIWDFETSSSNFRLLTFKKFLDFLLLSFNKLLNTPNDIKLKSPFLLRNLDAPESKVLHLLRSLLRNYKSSIFSNKSLLRHIRVLIDGEFNAFIILRSIMLGDKFVVFSEHLESFLKLRFRQVGFTVLSNEFQISLKRVRGVSCVQRHRV